MARSERPKACQQGPPDPERLSPAWQRWLPDLKPAVGQRAEPQGQPHVQQLRLAASAKGPDPNWMRPPLEQARAGLEQDGVAVDAARIQTQRPRQAEPACRRSPSSPKTHRRILKTAPSAGWWAGCASGSDGQSSSVRSSPAAGSCESKKCCTAAASTAVRVAIRRRRTDCGSVAKKEQSSSSEAARRASSNRAENMAGNKRKG